MCRFRSQCSSQYCEGCTFYPCDPCDFQGSFAFEPEKIPHELLEIMSHDPNIVQPNGCNECPTHGDQPVWIAPGDICDLVTDGFSAAYFDHCDTQYENDYEPSNHVKACLTEKQRDHLWETGHCHNVNTTLPYVAKEGLLFCVSGSHDPNQLPCLAAAHCSTRQKAWRAL